MRAKILLSSVCLLGCSLSASPGGPLPHRLSAQARTVAAAPMAKWTVMVYLAGDNDLEEYVVKDLEAELARPGSTPQVQVVALADRTPGYDTSRGDWTGTKLFHVTPGMLADPAAAVADWGERNLGDPATLAEFVAWTRAHYPAERYAIYFWGHGWNWHPGYTMEDKTPQDALDPDEVRAIQPRLGFIDLVAYDGCNMGSLEVEALWQGHAAAIVHSQEYVDWDGIEYDRVLTALNANPAMQADQLAVISNRSASLNQEKTGSAVALDQRFTRLLQALDAWSATLLAGLPRHRAAYARAFAAARHFTDAPDEKDLYDMARHIAAQVPDPQIQASSRALMAALDAALLDAWHAPDYAGAHGITLSLLNPRDEHAPYYRSLSRDLPALRQTRWPQFLEAYGN